MYNVDDLRKISFFENLDDKELKLLASFSRKKSFSKGEIVFYEKNMPSSLILLTEGVLKVYKTDLKNNEIVLHRFKPYSLVAEMVTLEGLPYPASGSFDTDGAIIEIDFEKFKKEFFNNPEVALNFFKSLSKKIKNLESVISLNIVLDSTARIAKYICENDEALTMKHSQLAQYLHMTPETLSRMFKKLVTLELVEKTSSGYVITNREGLRVLFE
ncbi:MAG: Crp/Fnr family transcriptional regulator [Epsilonproteobacteria bacterium]|nr:MAG: Crp/Fnr family transcriptional regulator [Campylobacterota bacterium]